MIEMLLNLRQGVPKLTSGAYWIHLKFSALLLWLDVGCCLLLCVVTVAWTDQEYSYGGSTGVLSTGYCGWTYTRLLDYYRTEVLCSTPNVEPSTNAHPRIIPKQYKFSGSATNTLQWIPVCTSCQHVKSTRKYISGVLESTRFSYTFGTEY